LNIALSLLRECSKIKFSPQKIRNILTKTPKLKTFIALNLITGTYVTTKLKTYINNLYIHYSTPSKSTKKTPVNKLKKLKLLLPKEKKTLSLLHDPDSEEKDPSPNQDKWPDIVKKYWGDKIWAAPTDDPEDINLILNGYTCPSFDGIKNRPYSTKKTDYRYQYPSHRRFREFPDPPNWFDVREAIRSSPSSAPGPDGIPFKAFREFPVISTQLIKNVLDEICSGNPPPEDFNRSNLYLIPKKQTHTIEDTRPIFLKISSSISARLHFRPYYK
jgi:hypothetical protein